MRIAVCIILIVSVLSALDYSPATSLFLHSNNNAPKTYNITTIDQSTSDSSALESSAFNPSIFDSSASNLPKKITPEKLSVKEKLKRHFISKQANIERTNNAQNSYKDFINAIEHEGTYFLYYQSFTPVWGINTTEELKAQVSLKAPIWRGALWSKGSIFVAYTQTIFFQNFNFRYSSPVRDIDYKPSVFYSYPANWKLFGGEISELRIGFLHYSNGVGGEECRRNNYNDPRPANCRSRSAANRLVVEALWQRGGFKIHLSAWPYISQRRDNPDLHRYMGYANMNLSYKRGRHLAEIYFSPLIADYTDYHASLRLGYSFGLNNFTSLYVQYFYGYGDNLYEYNQISHRIGVGFRIRSF